MCAEDGPPLSLVGDVRRTVQLQGIPTIPDLHIAVLLGVLCGFCSVDVDRGIE